MGILEILLIIILIAWLFGGLAFIGPGSLINILLVVILILIIIRIAK